MNLESLYRKRTKRLGIKARLHYGARRVFFILDRATRKFPGDIPLWMQYIEFAKHEKSSGVLAKTFAAALKLHPTKPELWVYAARHAVEENADITEARSHMQRGLRFCKKSKLMWREYAKLEMVFVAKVYMRRELLGIDKPAQAEKEDDGDNTMALPIVTAEDLNPDLKKKDQSLDMIALENIDTNPALNGALAIAIFDQAMREIPNDAKFAMEFFELFLEFARLRFAPKLLEHALKYMLDVAPTDAEVLWTAVRMPLIGVATTDPLFPARLQTVLENMSAAVEKVEDRAKLYAAFTAHFTSLLQEELDPAVAQVLAASVTKYFKAAEAEGSLTADMYAAWARLNLRREKPTLALRIASSGLAKFLNDEELQRITAQLETTSPSA